MHVNTKRGLAPIAVLIIALVIIAAIVYTMRDTAETPVIDVDVNATTTTSGANATSTTATSTTATSTTATSTTADGKYPAIGATITYTAAGYSPSQVTIKKGQTVRFVNASGKEFWPASANHPDHTIYPEFDPKKRLADGTTWEFTFDKVGKWNFHDHINATKFGSITVQ